MTPERAAIPELSRILLRLLRRWTRRVVPILDVDTNGVGDIFDHLRSFRGLILFLFLFHGSVDELLDV